MIISPPLATGMPFICLRKVGPQSRKPKRTTYTKKFAMATSQITLLPNTSRRRSAVVISDEGFRSVASISKSGSPSSCGPSFTQKKQNTAAKPASAAGT